MNVYAPPDPSPLGGGQTRGYLEQASGLGDLLNLAREDGDTRRYFAYASAILGRPYDGFYPRAGAVDQAPGEDAHVLIRPERALWPWRDFTVEYPPGMLVAALLPALFTTDFPTYHFLFCVLMELLLTAAVWLGVGTAETITRGAGRNTLIFSILFVTALGSVCVRRYDALVALAIAIAIRGLVARKPVLAGLGLAIGTVVKGTPLLLAPVAAIHWARRERWRELALAALVCALIGAIAAAAYGMIAGPRALDVLTYHVDRPVQTESPYGAGLMIADLFHPGLARVVAGYGSENVQSLWEPSLRRLSSTLLGLSIGGVFIWFWKFSRPADDAARNRPALVACTAVLIAFIGLGKVFSPQYMVWILPSGMIAATLSSERSFLLLVSAAAMTQVEFPFVYFLGLPWNWQILGVVAVIRDGLLLSSAVSLMIDASRRPEAIVEATPG